MHSALTPPIVGWRLNESADSIEVVQTPGAISWNCYHIAEGNVRYSYNTTGDPPRPLAYQLNRLEICDLTHTYTRIHDCKGVYNPTSPTAPRLLVGDTIVVCGTDGPQQNVTVQILHVDANAVSFHDRFGSVAACAAS